MTPDLPSQPMTYRPSGKVNWARFLPALIFPIGVCMAMALLLSWAYFHEWYYSFIAPGLAATVTGSALYLAVLIGQCRSRLVATVVGILVGAALYLGYYHAHVVSQLGWQGIARVDLLPKLINQRMRFGVWGVNINKNPWPPNPVWNWTRFGIDLVLVMAIVAGLGRSRAGRAYCESCDRWMRKHSFVAAPGLGQILADALKHSEIDRLETIESYPVRFMQPSTLIDVEYCRGLSDSESACVTYMTVSEFSDQPPSAEISSRDHVGVLRLIGSFVGYTRSPGLQKFLKQQALLRNQLLALAGKIPRLRSVAVLGAETCRSDQLARLGLSVGQATAVITPVDDSSVGIAFSTRLSVIQMVLSLTPILLVLAGAGVLYAAWAQWPQNQPLFSVWLVILGFSSLAVGATICCINLEYLNYRYTHRLTRRLVRSRPDAIVDPDDPECVFVAVVPRKNWTKLNLDDPSDRGFLLVDARERQLLFEGLRERYRIPANALISCEIEALDVGNHLFAAVVRARTAGIAEDIAGMQPAWTGWEAPFRPRPTKFARPRLLGPHSAEALRQRIALLLPPPDDFETSTSEPVLDGPST